MKKVYLSKVILAVVLGFFGLTNVNAQLTNTQTCDIVEIQSFDGNINNAVEARRYLADSGGEVILVESPNATTQWYRIPAGSVFIPEWIVVNYKRWEVQSEDGNTAQAYYYKNVNSNRYLYVDDESLAKLIEKRDVNNSDWPIEKPSMTEVNGKTDAFKWFEIPAQWDWGIYFYSAAGMDFDAAKPYCAMFAIQSTSLMSHEGSEFFGVEYPYAVLGGHQGGGDGNAWCAVRNPVIIEADVPNPDYNPNAAPDLVIMDIRWEPANPKEGDDVTFFATIKNQGDADSPSEVKHGLAFSVDGTISNTWCDAFFGPLAAGASIELSTTMEGSSGKVWKCGDKETYAIKAEIDDSKLITESDETNNTFEKVMTTGTSGIDGVIANKGNVYYANGALNLVNYPASAILSVYNLVGQTVSNNQKVSGKMNVNLSSGVYLVKVQSEGKSFTHKVIVK